MDTKVGYSSDIYNDDLGVQEESMLLESNEKKPLRSEGLNSRFSITWTKFGVIQLVLILLYTTAFVSLRRLLPRESLIYSPAQSAVQYQRQQFDAALRSDSIYSGPPSQAVDQAWTDLLQNMNIAVSKADIERIGSHSIPIPDRDGMYFAGLSVFHELHCIKRLRQFTWREHYFQNATADEQRLNRLHTDHCIDVLRQASLCHADTTLFTLEWTEESAQPRANFTQHHECKNFETLNKWAAERKVDASKPGVLTHPKFGISYPNGTSSKIGGTDDKSRYIMID